MKTIPIQSVENLLAGLKSKAKNDVVLFRGQSNDDPLLPKIARKNPKVDTSKIEKEMLTELRRRGNLLFSNQMSDDWDLLVHAQHYGMSTRLLDWTTNPLVAMFFACINQDPSYDSFVYVFVPDNNDLLDRVKNPDPFATGMTKVLKPTFNNNRIIAQSGWFTAHSFSKNGKKFVSLNSNVYYNSKVAKFQIPGKEKQSILIQLDIMGVNNASIFPDIEGTCKHINWQYL